MKNLQATLWLMFNLFPLLWLDISTYVADDGYLSNTVQNVKPDADILSPVGDGSSHLTNELVWVNANLKDVVGESEERSQRKGSHKDCNETELENFLGENNSL